MTFQFAVLEQLGDRAFDRCIGARIARRTQRRDAPERGHRRSDESGVHAGGEQIGERAKVHDVRAAVTSCDRQYGFALIVELVVVVVFEDHEAVTQREFAEARAAFRCHDDGSRKLMMRGEEHRAQSLLREQAFECVDVEAVFVDADRQQTGARQTQRIPRRWVAPGFDSDGVARRDQGARGEIDRLFDAVGDKKVVGADHEPARAREHRRELLAQAHVAARVGVRNQRATAAIECTMKRAAQRGIPIVGICAGYQMLGESVGDRKGVAGDAGILFVAAAGNDGSNNDRWGHYPSNYNLPNVISVAALDRADTLASFSNTGIKTVHVAAPGKAILSTWLGDGYREASGTSMATPYVSGVAALVIANEPSISMADLRKRLLSTVDKLPVLEGKIATGGRICAANALAGKATNHLPH